MGWQPQAFQRQVWHHFLAGKSGILQVPTGAGKTYGAFMGPLAALHADPGPGLQILYISPLRAMSRDIEAALHQPIQDLDWPYKVAARTGDTSAQLRQRQRNNLPHILITTPESLTVMISYPESKRLFRSLRAIILDEWHELMGSKRGAQTELALAYLRQCSPRLQTWALSATIGNLQGAAAAAVGSEQPDTVVKADIKRPLMLETLLPGNLDTFPWAGHLGLHMLPKLLERLDPRRSTLLFTNTRSQAERWFQGLSFYRPQWSEIMALHHGSIDKKERTRIEGGLKSGALRLVVCTASLDLGVDFAPVEQVIQVGSVKGIARLCQRAGRSGHRPGETARVLFVPTHALELLEISALRKALDRGVIEPRQAPTKPYDVLSQHLVTRAAGGGFTRREIHAEVASAHAYRNLCPEELDELLSFVEQGGKTLTAYAQYHKVKRTTTAGEDDEFTISSPKMGKMHRLGIGTITADTTLKLVYARGGSIGQIEEYFVAKLKPGDVFFFAGRLLQLARIEGMTAYVRRASGKTTLTPSWLGGRMPITASLSEQLRQRLDEIESSNDEELIALAPILTAQKRLSVLPDSSRLLLECCNTREGRHLFLYPFEGFSVHEGLAALLAFRLSQRVPATFSLSVNDYGIELLTRKDYPFHETFTPNLLAVENLAEDMLQSMNLGELQRRKFRDIAQIAGLVFRGYPGAQKTARQLQTSTTLLYDVFARHDPDHPLLRQAAREVLEGELERERLYRTLMRLSAKSPVWRFPERPTPFAFPLLIERLSARLSNENLLSRIERLKKSWTRR